MKKLLRRSYKTRSWQEAEKALQGLPRIDYDKADDLTRRGECFSVPEGWPRNWQWLHAIKVGADKINEQERRIADARARIVRLQASIITFREVFDRGDLWPGMKEVTVPCLRGGFETVVSERSRSGNVPA